MSGKAKPTPPTGGSPEPQLLPRNLEAEKAVLGAACVQDAAADRMLGAVHADSFYRVAHQTIYRAVQGLRETGASVDLVTLCDALRKSKQLDAVGGPVYVAGLVDGVPRSTNVEHYAAILRDLALKRALVAHAQRTIDLVTEASQSAAAIIADSDRRLMELQAGHVEGRMRSLAETGGDLYRDLEWRTQHRGELTGVTTGFTSIDELTLGWQPGELIIIAARTSIGKSTFVINNMVAAALGGLRGVVFSLEMRMRQLQYRILAQLSNTPLSRLLGGHLGDTEFGAVSGALGTMAGLPISIDDRAGQTVHDLRGACKRLKAEGGLDLVAIDYVQLVKGSLDRRGTTRNDELTDISNRLKVMADELSVPVLLLSQLNRGATDRADPRPKLSDLRDSGALEQDADLVCFLHRKNHREGGRTEFIVEKARNGPTGSRLLTLDRDVTTFLDGCNEPEPSAPEQPTERKARQAEFFRRRHGG